jgi:asparagine N-glycosylation enzyme membrane subunit Stt3
MNSPLRNSGMAAMYGFERQQLFTALILLVTALFVSSGVASAGPWHRTLRLAAIVFFVIAVVLALAEIVYWWTGLDH